MWEVTQCDKKWPTAIGFEYGGKGSWIKGCVWPVKAGKDQEMDFTLEPPEGIQPWWHLDFNPNETHVGLMTNEENEFLLF